MGVQEREVAWYRRHGRYPDRITHDASGRAYVEGDWSWRRRCPDRPEEVEGEMWCAGVYREPKVLGNGEHLKS